MKLNAAGVDDKQLRRLVLAALRKAGFGPKRAALSGGAGNSKSAGNSQWGSDVPVAGPSSAPLSALETVVRLFSIYPSPPYLVFKHELNSGRMPDDADEAEAEAWR